MAVEIRSDVNSPLGPGGVWGVSNGVVSGYFSGTLDPGIAYPLSSLVGLHQGETILIQHVQTTGQIRFGRVSQPPAYYSQNFETLNAGPLAGQDGWTIYAPLTSVLSPIVGAFAPFVQALGTIQLPEDGYWDAWHTPAANGVTDPYRFDYYIFAPSVHLAGYNAGDFLESTVYMVVNTKHDTSQYKWFAKVVQEDPGGTGDGIPCIQFGGVGAATAYFSLIPNSLNKISVVHDGGTALSFQVNDVEVDTDTIGTPASAGGEIVIINQSLTANASTAQVNPFVIKEINWFPTKLGLSGMLLVDGGGERLEAQLKPIDLDQFGIAMDSSALVDAQVEVFVLGS